MIFSTPPDIDFRRVGKILLFWTKKQLRDAFYLLLAGQLLFPYAVLAHPASHAAAAPARTNASSAVNPPASQGAGTTGLNLNLSSTVSSIAASMLSLNNSLFINVGGNKLSISANSLLTPAEFVAASQVLATGIQTLHLGIGGNASGGALSLTSSLVQSLTNLVVPQGVKLFDNVGQLGSLNLSGNLTNEGKFVLFSTNGAITGADISADNIYNLAGATLTTVLSPGHSSAVGGLNLTLNALGDITNAGTISSAGNLTLTAGGSITNALPAGVVATTVTTPSIIAAGTMTLSATNSVINAGAMSSAGNLSLQSATIINQGMISSAANLSAIAASQMQNLAGGQITAQQNVQLTTPALINGSSIVATNGNLLVQNFNPTIPMTVSNTDGTMQALSGNLSISSVSDVSIQDGDFSAANILLSAPNHFVHTVVNSLNGPVTIDAGSAFTLTESPTAPLNIADLDVTGDPWTEGAALSISSCSGCSTSTPFAAVSTSTLTIDTNISGSTVYLISGAIGTPASGSITGQSTTAEAITFSTYTITASGTLLISATGAISGTGAIINTGNPVDIYGNSTGATTTANEIALGSVTGSTVDIRSAKTAFSSLTFNTSTGAVSSGSFMAGANTNNNATAGISWTGTITGTTSVNVQGGAGTGSIAEGTGGAIISPVITLTCTGCAIGASGAPIIIGNGGSGVSLTATTSETGSAQNIYLSDTTTGDNVTITGTNEAGSSTSTYSLTTVGSILEGTSGAIQGATIILSSTSGSIGQTPATTQLFIDNNGSNTILTANATAAGQIIDIWDDTTSDNVTLAGTSAASSTGIFFLETVGSIIEGTSGAVHGGNVGFYSAGGAIGTSSTPVIVGNGGSGVSLSGSTATNGDGVYLSDTTSEAVSLAGGEAGISTGIWSLTAVGSILYGSGGAIYAPTIKLTSTTGSIGTSTLPIDIQNGGSGVSLTASATAASQNVYIIDYSTETVTLAGTSGADTSLGTFSVTAYSVAVSGAINADLVNLSPLNSAETVSLGGSSSDFNISTTTLGNINVGFGQLNIGSSNSGAFTIGADITVPSNISGQLFLESGSTFSNPDTITFSNSEALRIDAASTVSTGTIKSTIGNALYIYAGGTLTVSGAITLGTSSGSAYAGLETTGSNAGIVINNAISTGAPYTSHSGGITLLTNGSGAISGTGTLSSGDFGFMSTSGLISSNGSTGAMAIVSTGGELSVQTAGSAYVSNTGAITIEGYNEANVFSLTASGAIAENTPGYVLAPTILLTSTSGSIGSSGAPIVISNGGNGVSLTALAGSSGQSVYISDTTAADNVTLAGSPAASSTGTFSLSTSGSIVKGTSTSISGGTLILTSAAGSIGVSATPIYIANGGSGVNITANANGASQSVYLYTASTDNVTLLGSSGAGSGGTFYITGGPGNILEGASGLITAPNIVLTTANFGGTVGLSGTPILISNGGSGVNLTALANTTGNNVYISDTQTEAVTMSGASGTGSSGTFSLTAAGSIMDGGSVTITSPTISLTSTAGSIGISGTPILVSNGGSGVSLTASADTAGKNIYLSDTTAGDTVKMAGSPGVSSTGIFSLSSSASIIASAIASITGGTIILASTAGSVGASGAPIVVTNGGSGVSLTATATSASQNVYISDTTASDSVTLLGTSQAGTSGTVSITATSSIFEGASGLAYAPTVKLTSTAGSIGVSTTPVKISDGGNGVTVTAVASAASQNVYVSDTTASDSVTLAGTSEAGTSGTVSITASSSILEGASGLVEAPNISLASTAGTIGANTGGGALIIGNGGSGLNLTARTSTTSQNIWLSDTQTETVTLTGSSGTSTSGNFYLTAYNVSVSGTLNAPTVWMYAENASESVSLGLSGNFNLSQTSLNNITASTLEINAGVSGAFSTGTITAPSSIGSLWLDGSSFTGSGTINAGSTNLYISAGTTVSTGTITSTGTPLVEITAGTTLTTGSITLGTSGDGGDVILTGNPVVLSGSVSTSSTSLGSVSVTASGSSTISGAGQLTSGQISLSSTSGAIGTSSTPIYTYCGELAANTAGSVYLNNNLGGGSVALFPSSSASGSGQTFSLTNGGAILNSYAETISSPTIILITNGYGSIGTNANPIKISNGGSGVTLTAFADITNSLNVYISDSQAETVTLAGSSSTGNVGTFSLTAYNVAITGTVTAPSGSVYLIPNSTTETVSLAGSNNFNLSQASLNNVTTTNFYVGSATDTGAFVTGASITAPSTVSNLLLNTGGTFSNSGFTFTLGGTDLGVTALSTINTGTVSSTTTPTVNFIAGSTLTVGGAIILGTTTNGGSVSLQTNVSGAGIVLSNAVSTSSTSAGSIEISTSGSGAISGASTLTAGSISFYSASGLISSNGSTGAINTVTTGTLLAQTTGSVYLSNTGACTLDTSSASGAGHVFSLTATGSISEGASQNITAPTITLTSTSGSIGVSGTPMVITNGGSGVTLTATASTAGKNIYISDTTVSDTVTVTGSPGVSSTGTFSLSSSASITESSLTSVTGGTIILTSTAGSIGASGAPITINNGGSGVALTVSANTAAKNIYVSDTTASDTVTVTGSPGVSSTGTFSLSSSASITASSLSSVTGGTIILTSTAGSIGANGAPIVISNGGSGVTLTALANSASQNVYIFDTHTDTVTLSGSSAAGSAGTFSLTAYNPSISGTVSASSVYLIPESSTETVSLGGSSNFNVATASLANVTTTNLYIGSSGDSGAFTTGASVTAPANLTLYGGGTFSNSGNTITLGSHNLTISITSTVNTGAISGSTGTIGITGNGVTVGGAIAQTGAASITLTSSGGITASSAVTVGSGGSVTLQTTNNGSISMAANVGGAATSVTVSANGSGSISQSAGAVLGSTVQLSSGSGSIGGSGTPIAISNSGSGVSLTALTTGTSVYVSDSQTETVTLTGSSGAGTGGTLSLTAYSASISGTINAPSVLLIPNTTETVSVGGSSTFNVPTASFSNITATNLTIGSLSDSDAFTTGASITAPANLTLNGGGTFSNSGNTITLGSHNLTITAALTANTGTITSTTGPTVNITAGNTLTVGGAITLGTTTAGGNITLQITAGNAGIALSSAVSTSSTSAGSIYVSANGSGTISGAGTLTAGTITLTSTSGLISSNGSTGTIATATTGTLSANTTGSVYLSNTGAFTLNASSASGASQTFSLTSTGTISAGTSPNITAPMISLTSTSGSIGSSGVGSVTISNGGSGVSLTASANAASQNVYISDSQTETVTLTGASQAGTSGIFSLTSYSAAVTGTLNAPSVYLIPESATETVSIAGASNFNISATSLGKITASSGLYIGSSTNTQAFTTGASFTAPANLTLTTGGTFSNSGNTITLGANNLTVTAASTVNTGTITSTTGPTVNITAGNTLTVGGAITLGTTTAGGSISLATNANNGGVTVANNVSAQTGVTISANGTGVVTVNSSESVLSSNITVNTTSFADSGTLTAAYAAGNESITIQSSGALTMSGSPQPITITGGDANAIITVSASGGKALNMNSAYSFSAGSAANGYAGTGGVILSSQGSGGSINFNNGATQTVTSGSYFGVASPAINFSASSALNATGSSLIDIHSGPDITSSLAQTITLPDSASGGTINITTTDGSIQVGPYYAANLLITKSAGSNTATLNFSGGPVNFYSNGDNMTIGAAASSNVVVQSNSNMLFDVGGGGTFTDNGIIKSTNTNGNITITNTGSGGGITLAGTPQSAISVSPVSGPGSILLQVPAGTLTVDSSYTFDPGTAGNTDVQAASVVVSGAGTTFTSGNSSSLEFDFLTNLTFSGTSEAITSAATTGGGIYFGVYSGPSLVVTAPNNATATISTAGGSINFIMQSVEFSKGSGGNTTTFSLTGGNTNINAYSNMTIDPSVIVSASNNIAVVLRAGSFTDNGTLTSTNSGGSISITGSGGTGGTASLTLNGTPQNAISISGTGGSISLTGYDSGMTINNDYTFNPGNAGSVSLTTTSGALTINNQVTVDSAANTASLSVNTPSLSLANSALLSDSETSGTALTINSPLTGGMTITETSAGTGTISTSGGNIAINVNGPLTFAQSNSEGATLTTLNLNAGTVTANCSGSVVINPHVNLGSTSNLTFNVTSTAVTVSGAVETSTGSITLSATTGALTIGANAVVYADQGNLVIQNNNSLGGTIALGADANIEAYSSTNGQGNVDIVIGPIPETPVAGLQPANTTTNITGGGAIYWGQNSISATSPTNTINAEAATVVFNTGGLGPSAISLGGGVTITADPPLPTGGATAYPGPSVVSFNGTTQALFAQSGVATAETENVLSNNSNVDNSVSSSVNQFDINYRSSNPDDSQQDNLHDVIARQLKQTEKNRQAIKEKAGDDSDKKDDDDDDDDQIINNPAIDDKPLTPIAYSHPSAAMQLSEIETETALIKASSQTRISTKTCGLVSVIKGDALIFASKSTVIQCGAWKMTLAPNTIVLVNKQNQTLKIRNIYEAKAGSLNLSYANKQLKLENGQAVIVGPNEESVKESLRNSVGRVKPLDMIDGQYAVTCDFGLDPLLSSPDGNAYQDNHSLAEALYKKAAGILLITYNH